MFDPKLSHIDAAKEGLEMAEKFIAVAVSKDEDGNRAASPEAHELALRRAELSLLAAQVKATLAVAEALRGNS
jgi:hypothetical protein